MSRKREADIRERKSGTKQKSKVTKDTPGRVVQKKKENSYTTMKRSSAGKAKRRQEEPLEEERLSGKRRGTAGSRKENKKQMADRRKNTKRQMANRSLENKNRKRGNRQIITVAYCVVAVFVCMIGYLLQFMINDSQDIINNPRNKRQNLLAERVVRGEILSSDGKTLARTVSDGEGNETREYSYGKVFCHVVGRTDNSMTGIEQSQSFPLLTSHSNPLKKLANEFRGEKNLGDNVVTTLDAKLQQTAYDGLGNFRGAVVAIEPSTGKILAMVSKPSYDPNTVLADWDELVEDSGEESPLLNRATQGLYPPGSTFKVLTALEYMEEHSDYRKYQYECKGEDTFQGSSIHCYGGERHGKVGLKSSLAESCNGSFANIGMMLDLNSFGNLCKRFGFNRKLSVDFEYNTSRFSLNAKSTSGEITQTAIGQGKTMITPLQNALISAAIANDGVMMTPYLVDHIENDQGQYVKSYEPQKDRTVISSKMANNITKMMKSVVNDGTASSLRYLSYQVAGKTGTAEIDSEGTSHAWFVGFAPAGNPKIAVSVVVEGAGTGSQYAVPIAKTMFQTYLGN